MRHIQVFLLLLFAPLFVYAGDVVGDIKPVAFTQVHFTDDFWSQRLSVMRNTTIRYAFDKCEAAGELRNFEYAGKIVSGEAEQGELTFQSGNVYDDAEVYKVLEGAAYLLSVEEDEELEEYCDNVIDLICSAQEADGYLQTNFTIHNPLHEWYNGEKWTSDWNLSHETFNVAELIESAVAYYYATGKTQLLNCAIRAADNLCEVFNEDGLKEPPGHAVIEMALVRLYELTGEEKYLNECKFFLDCRGLRQFDPTSDDQRVNGKYWQNHLPAVEQRTAEGHAVRALYFYSGMADWVRYSGDADYEAAVTAIWDNIDSKKFYITGGFGARDENESFGDDYELPNATAYCETCASVAGVMFNERMFRLHGEAKYIDMLERALYNTVLGGISIRGTTFYYPNRLEVTAAGNERSEWFGTSCCPTNLCRLIPSVPGYVYATDDTSLYINLFVNSTATIELGDAVLSIEQTTDYPYEGDVKFNISLTDEGQDASSFDEVRIRIPGWAVNKPVSSDLYSYINPTAEAVRILIDGAEYNYSTNNGYAIIPKDLALSGEIEMVLPMEVHQVVSCDSLTSNHNLLSYERGPIVFCAEGVDNYNALDDIYIPEGATFTERMILSGYFDGGLKELVSEGVQVTNNNGDKSEEAVTVRLIPYFGRAHRTAGQMKVWLPKDESRLESALAYIDKVQPCDDADEASHNLQGSNMNVGTDLGWRDSDGGYISYDMKVDPEKPMDFIMKLWGSDSGNRNFDIYVDNSKFSYEEVENFAPNEYYYIRHAIPFEYTQGKEKVTLRMQSINGSRVGGLFGVYTAVSENTPAGTVPVDYLSTVLIQYVREHGYSSNGDYGTFRNRRWFDGSGEEGQSWTMAVNPDDVNYLMIYYWGGESDAREFNIYCDDVLVGSEYLLNNSPGRFFFSTYALPAEVSQGKESVTIHLSSPSGTKTGGIFYAYMMSPSVVNGIAEVESSELGNSSPAEWYNLTGMAIKSPTRGVNIVKEGTAVRKIVKR